MILTPLPAPRLPVLRAVGLAATALAAAALLVWPPAATGWNQGSAEGTLWQLMNGARVNNGRRAVQQHATLVSLARWRSKDQVERNYFSHDVLGTGYQVYHWYDLNGLNYTWGGENIGWNNGYADADSPVKIHEGFMNSPGHRANVLEPSFTHGGVGAFAADNVNFLGKVRSPRFYTELFMAAAAAPAPPPPPPPPSGNSNPPPPPAQSGTPPPPSGAAPPPPAQAAASAAPAASVLRVDSPAPPAAEGSAEARLVTNLDVGPEPAEQRAESTFEPVPAARHAAVATTVRIEAPSAAESGLFETVLGSLLGLIL